LQSQISDSSGDENHKTRTDDARNIIAQKRVNKARYAWNKENYEDDEKEMGALCFTRRVRITRVPKDSNYHTINISTMGHKNLGCGYQITFKQYKYWEEQEQQQCKVYNYTSPAQHGPG
jgi:hypothetical protein